MSYILTGDCLAVMPTLEAESVDAIVSDPPYGLAFMGKAWDHGVPGPEFWREALRVAKPGAHLVAFGGTRTYHRLTCAIEDAGWEIRDCLSWIYGSGFPKSLDVSKAMDKAAGAEREVVGVHRRHGGGSSVSGSMSGELGTASELPLTTPATALAREWQGWGTALKPAWEPIILARKPLTGTVASNVAQHGTGALNVDGCRIEGGKTPRGVRVTALGRMNDDSWMPKPTQADDASGRWPANVCLDEEAAAMLDAQTGNKGAQGKASGPTLTGESTSASRGKFNGVADTPFYGDSGGASRFFFVAQEGQCDNANTAEPSLSQSSGHGGSAQSGAVTADSLEAGPQSPCQRGQDCTADCTDCTPCHSLASSVGAKDNTDTTPTTPTYCGSCGSALPVTVESTNPASEGRAEGVNVPVSGMRFLYSPKASRREREAGLEGMEKVSRDEQSAWIRECKVCGDRFTDVSTGKPKCGHDDVGYAPPSKAANHHPTVKPIALMRWLCRLVTPKGGLILDPFTGSGTTGCAAVLEGFRFVGIEREPEYAAIAEKRIAHWAGQVDEPTLFD